MTEKERIEVLADILEVDDKEIIREKNLDEFESCDSLAVLSLISVIGESYDRYPSGNEISKLATVGDLIDLLGE